MLKKRTTARQRDNGVRVVNYARWKSREDFDAMVKNPEAKAT
jgi:heme-degrading monooxygenase HmoA